MITVGPVEADEVRELRRSVLRPNLRPDDPLPGDDRPDAVFLGALDDSDVVGTCYLVPEPDPAFPDQTPAWQLRQMAVSPERRGAGIGALVLDAAVDLAVSHGARRIWCQARATAAGFYAAHGWARQGDEYVERDTGLPHVPMGRSL